MLNNICPNAFVIMISHLAKTRRLVPSAQYSLICEDYVKSVFQRQLNYCRNAKLSCGRRQRAIGLQRPRYLALSLPLEHTPLLISKRLFEYDYFLKHQRLVLKRPVS